MTVMTIPDPGCLYGKLFQNQRGSFGKNGLRTVSGDLASFVKESTITFRCEPVHRSSAALMANESIARLPRYWEKMMLREDHDN